MARKRQRERERFYILTYAHTTQYTHTLKKEHIIYNHYIHFKLIQINFIFNHFLYRLAGSYNTNVDVHFSFFAFYLSHPPSLLLLPYI